MLKQSFKLNLFITLMIFMIFSTGTLGEDTNKQSSTESSVDKLKTSLASKLLLGMFIRPDYKNHDFSALSDFVTQTGVHPSIWQAFYSWQDVNHKYVSFSARSTITGASGPKDFCDYVYDVLKAVPQITWRPGWVSNTMQMEGPNSAQPDFLLKNLVDGRHDAYIDAFAQEVKAYGRLIFIRLMHEMNATSYPWSYNNPNNPGNTPAQYVSAWKYIVDRFRAKGVTNVIWVWNAGSGSFPGTTWQDFYPGDEWVDWVSLDGYNAQRAGASVWKTMDMIFGKAYDSIIAFSSRPMSISETASVENAGGDTAKKADWITDGYLKVIPNRFPRIHAILYFNEPGRGFSYPLNSTLKSLDAFKSVASSDLFKTVSLEH